MADKSAREVMAATELVQYHLSQAAEFAATLQRIAFDQWLSHGLTAGWTDFESPLEMVFWLWFRACQSASAKVFSVQTQFDIEINGKAYRSDFAVLADDGDASQLLLVEVDGHAFHERTPEQVAVRDSRDRALLSSGFKVFYFSYQELTTKPWDCVYEVLLAARAEQERRGLGK